VIIDAMGLGGKKSVAKTRRGASAQAEYLSTDDRHNFPRWSLAVKLL
jgi:hypothetical protein